MASVTRIFSAPPENFFKVPPKIDFKISSQVSPLYYPAAKMLAQLIPQIQGQYLSTVLYDMDAAEINLLRYEEGRLSSFEGKDLCYETSMRVSKTAGGVTLMVAPFFWWSVGAATVVSITTAFIYDYALSFFEQGIKSSDNQELIDLAAGRLERIQFKIRTLESCIQLLGGLITETEAKIGELKSRISYGEWITSFFRSVPELNERTIPLADEKIRLSFLRDEEKQLRVAKAFFFLNLNAYLAKKIQ